MKLKLALFALTFSTLSFAGNGSSGGGNIYGDQLNPWFLPNTKTVSYCVEIDPEFSSLSKTRILEIINKSFAYWKKTFAESISDFSHDFPFEVKLATQSFIYNDTCSATTDLKFQLGFLSPEQKKALPNYKQLLGLAYRDSYDEVNLRGKGFIYIAPENGPMRPASVNLHKSPWSFQKNMALELVITHEIGHIFGLQDDHYSRSALMGATFAEMITSKNSISYVNSHSANTIPSPFGCNKKFEGEYEIDVMQSEVPESTTTVSSFMKDDLRTMLGLPNKFNAKFKTSNGLMTIKLDNKNYASINLSEFGNISGGLTEAAITVYLTKKQNVFSKLPNAAFNTHLQIYDVKKSISRKDEEMKLVTGKSLKVFIQYDQFCIPSIGTIHNDEVYFDIFTL